jgi:mannitol/fructose-specific phosphotransferase system IIA component
MRFIDFSKGRKLSITDFASVMPFTEGTFIMIVNSLAATGLSHLRINKQLNNVWKATNRMFRKLFEKFFK